MEAYLYGLLVFTRFYCPSPLFFNPFVNYLSN